MSEKPDADLGRRIDTAARAMLDGHMDVHAALVMHGLAIGHIGALRVAHAELVKQFHNTSPRQPWSAGFEGGPRL